MNVSFLFSVRKDGRKIAVSGPLPAPDYKDRLEADPGLAEDTNIRTEGMSQDEETDPQIKFIREFVAVPYPNLEIPIEPTGSGSPKSKKRHKCTCKR